ncbi:hypothetical protein ACS0TY_002900 [Phlomoides rotata]
MGSKPRDTDEDVSGPRCGQTLTAVTATKTHGPRLILFGGATAIGGGNGGTAGIHFIRRASRYHPELHMLQMLLASWLCFSFDQWMLFFARFKDRVLGLDTDMSWTWLRSGILSQLVATMTISATERRAPPIPKPHAQVAASVLPRNSSKKALAPRNTLYSLPHHITDRVTPLPDSRAPQGHITHDFTLLFRMMLAGRNIHGKSKIKENKVQGIFVNGVTEMTRMLDILEDYLMFRGYYYNRIDGNTGGEDRDASIENFNKPGSDKCRLVSISELYEKEVRCLMKSHKKNQDKDIIDEDNKPQDVVVPLTAEEQEEKERLLEEGFSTWSRRDFNNFIRACEKYGRNDIVSIASEIDGKTEEEVEQYAKVFMERYKELNEYDRIIKNIERGEARLARKDEIMKAIGKKLDRFKNPWVELKIHYGQNKGKLYNEKCDRFMERVTSYNNSISF